MNSFHAEVTDSVRLYGDTHLLWFVSPPDMNGATPGQFVMAYAGEGADPLLGRALSIHRVRTTDRGAEFALLFDVDRKSTRLNSSHT